MASTCDVASAKCKEFGSRCVVHKPPIIPSRRISFAVRLDKIRPYLLLVTSERRKPALVKILCEQALPKQTIRFHRMGVLTCKVLE